MFNVATHNGYITVSNPKTGGHRTFKISTVRNEKSALHGKRVVSLLTGPNREDYTNWTGFGFATESGVVVWRKNRGTAYEKHAKLLTNPEAGEEYGLEYLFEGRCRCCNRALTNPVAVKLGIGPECGGHGNAKSALAA